MSKSLKAALLSAFIFPGAGHFLLKKYVPGSILAGVSIVSLYFLLSTTLDMAQEISTKIQLGEIPLDTSSITESILSLSASNAQSVNTPTFLLIACWLIGIIAAYISGRSSAGNE